MSTEINGDGNIVGNGNTVIDNGFQEMQARAARRVDDLRAHFQRCNGWARAWMIAAFIVPGSLLYVLGDANGWVVLAFLGPLGLAGLHTARAHHLANEITRLRNYYGLF